MTNLRVTRPAPDECAPFYHAYIALVPDGDPLATLQREVRATRALLEPLGDERALHRYAPGKWSIKEVIGHLADVERVLAMRGLWFARNDPASLPGFAEDNWAPEGVFDRRPLSALLDELEAVRAATVATYEGIPLEHWSRRGIANNVTFSARVIPWIVAGHELHHRRILQERYLH